MRQEIISKAKGKLSLMSVETGDYVDTPLEDVFVEQYLINGLEEIEEKKKKIESKTFEIERYKNTAKWGLGFNEATDEKCIQFNKGLDATWKYIRDVAQFNLEGLELAYKEIEDWKAKYWDGRIEALMETGMTKEQAEEYMEKKDYDWLIMKDNKKRYDGYKSQLELQRDNALNKIESINKPSGRATVTVEIDNGFNKKEYVNPQGRGKYGF